MAKQNSILLYVDQCCKVYYLLDKRSLSTPVSPLVFKFTSLAKYSLRKLLGDRGIRYESSRLDLQNLDNGSPLLL